MKYEQKERVVYKGKVHVVTDVALYHDLPVYNLTTPDLSACHLEVPEYKLSEVFLRSVS